MYSFGKETDLSTGFVQLDARTYDPKKGRFIQTDQYNFANLALPQSARSELMAFVGFQTKHLLNDPDQQLRYGYARGNPLRWDDPNGLGMLDGEADPENARDGNELNEGDRSENLQEQARDRAAERDRERDTSRLPAALAAAGTSAAVDGPSPIGDLIGLGILGAALVDLAIEIFSSNDDENTNPFDGPVNDDVIVVDSNGNAIPVNQGEQLGGSEDGEWIQVKDSEGNPTGIRLDGSHGPGQPPHGHRPGVDIDGDPHLPINTKRRFFICV